MGRKSSPALSKNAEQGPSQSAFKSLILCRPRSRKEAMNDWGRTSRDGENTSLIILTLTLGMPIQKRFIQK